MITRRTFTSFLAAIAGAPLASSLHPLAASPCGQETPLADPLPRPADAAAYLNSLDERMQAELMTAVDRIADWLEPHQPIEAVILRRLLIHQAPLDVVAGELGLSLDEAAARWCALSGRLVRALDEDGA